MKDSPPPTLSAYLNHSTGVSGEKGVHCVCGKRGEPGFVLKEAIREKDGERKEGHSREHAE